MSNEKFPSEKAVAVIITLVTAFSLFVAAIALVWANWAVFRAALTVFISVLFGVCMGYYMASRFGKK